MAKESLDDIAKRLAESPIVLPRNAYVEALNHFGRDELIALVFNVFGTAGLEGLFNSGTGAGMTEGAKKAWLSVVGPLVEKVGFFAGNLNDARNVFNTTPERGRKPRGHYAWQGFKRGARSLAIDVAVHDPIYISTMWFGQQSMPGTPAWMLSLASFTVGVLAGSAVDVGVDETRYLWLKGGLKRAGFGKESYLESRFLVNKQQDPSEILKVLSDDFDLPDAKTAFYKDKYFPSKFPELSGRKGKFRLRQRQDLSDASWVQSAQIVYTKATKMAQKSPEQFSYFPTRKDKFYYVLDGQDMPQHPSEIENEKAQKAIMKRLDGQDPHDVHFARTAAYDREKIFVSTDYVDSVDRPYYVVEIKSYYGKEQKQMLVEAMRRVMLDFPLIQTTHSKLYMTKNSLG